MTKIYCPAISDYCDDANRFTEEADKLRLEVERLRGALQQFAEFDDHYCDSYAWVRRVAKEALENENDARK